MVVFHILPVPLQVDLRSSQDIYQNIGSQSSEILSFGTRTRWQYTTKIELILNLQI